MTEIMPKKMAILRYIRAYRRQHGYSPTMEEIGGHLGVSKVTIYEHVNDLVKKGVLKRGPKHKARSLRISEEFTFPEDAREGLPLLGRIAAGVPLEAVEDCETVAIEDMFPPDGDTFLLEVGGDSMVGDHICEGDIVVCRRTETARDGDIVVALLDGGEATLKRYYRESNGIRLQPSNDRYEPIITDAVNIQGVVKGVIRQT